MSIHSIHHDLYKAAKGLADPGDGGTIRPVQDLQVCEMVTTGAETRTLLNPTKPGIYFTLRLLTAGGDAVVTAENGLNVTLNTEATFDAAGEALELISVTKVANTTYRWEILNNIGSVGLA